MEHWAKIRLRIAFNAVWIHFGSSGIEIDTTIFPHCPLFTNEKHVPLNFIKETDRSVSNRNDFFS